VSDGPREPGQDDGGGIVGLGASLRVRLRAGTEGQVRKALTLALVGIFGAGTAEAAWEFRDYVTPLGDKGTGLFQAETEGAGVSFFFACDGDRWRMAGLLPSGSKPLRMDPVGKIRFSYTEGYGPAGVWKPTTLPSGLIAYEVPQPTTFVGNMLTQERKDPDTRIRFELLDTKKKRVKLFFSLRGLGEAIREHLWEPCKLGVYFPDPRDSEEK
jgi:hypothetical protein